MRNRHPHSRPEKLKGRYMEPSARFQVRLAETMAWCTTRDWGDAPSDGLRTVELRPNHPEGSDMIVPPLTRGRLLAFNLDETLSDGAANLASYGFFDDNNIPAWDTWIMYVTGDTAHTPRDWSWTSYLLSWVPEVFVDVVSDGIAVNPEECIRWATDLASPFLRASWPIGTRSVAHNAYCLSATDVSAFYHNIPSSQRSIPSALRLSRGTLPARLLGAT
jgi:hypothetical protein